MGTSVSVPRAVAVPGDAPCPAVPYAADVPPVSRDRRVLDRADRHLMLLDDGGTLVARCSCWWRELPRLHGRILGTIGHYAAVDVAAGTALLAQACAELAAAGCTDAAGPMDGSTWRTYRLITDTGPEPPFFLEPLLPAAYRDHWTAAGFEPIAGYSSALVDDLSIEDARIGEAAARLANRGIVIRPLSSRETERDLRRMFELAVEVFRRGFLYGPIEESEFLERTRPLLSVVKPELVLLAESRHSGGSLCGFLFAIPDVLQAPRGVPIDTVIIKTVAAAPGRAHAGLGSVLVAHAHRVARDLGYRRAIHALMHDGNGSRHISRRYARTFRRYALLGRRL